MKISPAKAQRRKEERKEILDLLCGLSLRLCAFAGVILLFQPLQPKARNSTTPNSFTRAKGTVPSPATPVTNALTTPPRRAFRVTKHALIVIAASSRHRKYRCAPSVTRTSAATIRR